LDVQREIGAVQFLAGRYGEAIDTLQRVVAAEPRFPFAPVYLGRALLFAGRLAEALPVLEQLDGGNLGRFKASQARRAPWLARAYVMNGGRAEAETLVAEHEDSPFSLVIIHAALGNKDRAFDALERMAAVEPHHVGPMLMNPEMAVLRGDPRLAPLRKRFNLP
jgi:tetratricopeptide (TPR) repeat protein